MSAKGIPYKGVTYPTQKALAEHLGISQQAVSVAIKEGRLEELASEKRGYPVQIGPYSWPSKSAFARFVGLSRHQIYEAEKHPGRLKMFLKRKLRQLEQENQARNKKAA